MRLWRILFQFEMLDGSHTKGKVVIKHLVGGC